MQRIFPTRATMRWLMALFYLGASIVHLRSPDAFLPIMPPWVPQPHAVVLATGWCELAGAIGLLVPALRKAAGVGLAIYAVAVFPANIYHAMQGIDIAGMHQGWWYHGPRLLAQPVLVWWALFCAGMVDWPWRSNAEAK